MGIYVGVASDVAQRSDLLYQCLVSGKHPLAFTSTHISTKTLTNNCNLSQYSIARATATAAQVSTARLLAARVRSDKHHQVSYSSASRLEQAEDTAVMTYVLLREDSSGLLIDAFSDARELFGDDVAEHIIQLIGSDEMLGPEQPYGRDYDEYPDPEQLYGRDYEEYPRSSRRGLQVDMYDDMPLHPAMDGSNRHSPYGGFRADDFDESYTYGSPGGRQQGHFAYLSTSLDFEDHRRTINPASIGRGDNRGHGPMLDSAYYEEPYARDWRQRPSLSRRAPQMDCYDICDARAAVYRSHGDSAYDGRNSSSSPRAPPPSWHWRDRRDPRHHHRRDRFMESGRYTYNNGGIGPNDDAYEVRRGGESARLGGGSGGLGANGRLLPGTLEYPFERD